MSDEQKNSVTVTFDGQDQTLDMETLGVTIDSTQSEILDAVRGIITEMRGDSVGFDDDDGECTYTVHKAINTNAIFVYPKPVAGK